MKKKQVIKLLTKNKNPEAIIQEKEKIHSLKAQMNLERTWGDKLADFLTEKLGTTWFLIFNAAFFAFWIATNNNLIPGIQAFDPFPYGLLTMIVSLEAIFLSIIVLISQNRAAYIADLREEIDLQINIRSEDEITKILNLVDKIHDHLGLKNEDDKELATMKQKTNLSELEKELASEMRNRR